MREGFQTAGLKARTEAEAPRLEKPLTEGALVQHPRAEAGGRGLIVERRCGVSGPVLNDYGMAGWKDL